MDPHVSPKWSEGLIHSWPGPIAFVPFLVAGKSNLPSSPQQHLLKTIPITLLYKVNAQLTKMMDRLANVILNKGFGNLANGSE